MNIEVKNICNDFFKFFEEASKVETLEEKKTLWNRIYEEPNKDIFDIYYQGWGNRKNLDIAIIEKFPKEIDRIKKVNSIIESKIKEISLKCSKLFDSYDLNFNYIVMVGTFSSDGWGCIYNNKPTVFFSIEFEKDPNYFGIFLAHEITHNFHMNINKNDLSSLADNTLAEGMAVVASKIIYPGFRDTEYLNLDNRPKGDTWLNKCKDIFKTIKDEYVSALSNDNDEIIRKYFWGKIDDEKDVPNRIGYVIGKNIVEELIKTYSFYELASWSSEETFIHVKKTLNLII
jgi:hypothetical protein